MRHLPLLEVGDEFKQVAFPDVHAIALADAFLKPGKEQREAAFRSVLLDSPMLLFWAFGKWLAVCRSQPPVPVSTTDFEGQLLSIIDENCPDLVCDHVQQLTSVQRIEVNEFLDLNVFFELSNDRDLSFVERIFQRVSIFEMTGLVVHIGGEQGCLAQRVSGDGDFERFQLEFEKSDFSQFKGRQQLADSWNFELPFFKSGFDGLQQKLERLSLLESEFSREVEKEKIASMRQLAYGASHEVNNPLANISTRAQALLRDETDPKRRQRLQTIDAQAFRAHDMISNLMTFARPPRPVFERIQLSTIVTQAIEPLRGLASEQEIEIEVDVENSIYFDADSNQLQEMLFALVQNAIEAVRRDGKIKVRSCCQAPGEPVEIDVMDNGPGISGEVRRHIFDPFFSGREAGRGLGFGLSKVWRLMELHHGRVQVLERDGLTCVQLAFPGSQASTSDLEIEQTA